jgi:hypothetical protein
LVGGILGGIVGFGGGAVGGTFVLPGGGTIAGGWEGGAGGAAVGTVAGAYLGGVIGNAIESILNKSKAKPPCNERDDYCKDIYDADLEVCWSLPRKDQQAACARQAAIRYGECLAKGEPSSPLSWW